jgi:hypothetical protein
VERPRSRSTKDPLSSLWGNETKPFLQEAAPSKTGGSGVFLAGFRACLQVPTFCCFCSTLMEWSERAAFFGPGKSAGFMERTMHFLCRVIPYSLLALILVSCHGGLQFSVNAGDNDSGIGARAAADPAGPPGQGGSSNR